MILKGCIMTKMKIAKILVGVIAVVAATLAVLNYLNYQETIENGPGKDLGPATGTFVGDFSLPDANGSTQDFTTLRGDNGVVLSFVRSADWCFFCKLQLVDFEQGLVAELAERGYGFAAVSYDSQQTINNFQIEKGLSYTHLSDMGSKLIERWGLTNTNASPGDWYGYPHPIIMIIDSEGNLEAKMFEQSYRDRPQTEAILELIDSL